VCPELTIARYAVERLNPMFLFRRVLVSEDAFLEFTDVPGYFDAAGGSAKKKAEAGLGAFNALFGASIGGQFGT
jgi:hypothetical protein